MSYLLFHTCQLHKKRNLQTALRIRRVADNFFDIRQTCSTIQALTLWYNGFVISQHLEISRGGERKTPKQDNKAVSLEKSHKKMIARGPSRQKYCDCLMPVNTVEDLASNRSKHHPLKRARCTGLFNSHETVAIIIVPRAYDSALEGQSRRLKQSWPYHLPCSPGTRPTFCNSTDNWQIGSVWNTIFNTIFKSQQTPLNKRLPTASIRSTASHTRQYP